MLKVTEGSYSTTIGDMTRSYKGLRVGGYHISIERI